MIFNCEETRESLAAYAFDALSGEERHAVVEHLAECRLHDADLADLRSTTDALAESVTAVRPPARLGANLMTAFEAASRPAARPEMAAGSPERRRLWERLQPPQLAYGIAAALLIATLGLFAWTVSQGDNANDLLVQTTQNGNLLRVLYSPELDIGVIHGELPPAPAGHVYQAWMIADGAPTSLGLLATNSGVTAFTADLADATTIAITLEPGPGSALPTTPPIISAGF